MSVRVLLNVVEGKSKTEIAGAENVHEHSVRAAITRGIEKMREQLKNSL